MSGHQKRLSVPDSWPVGRKEIAYTVKAEGPHGDDGVPLLIVLRDVLGYVDSRKEARYALDQGSILIDGSQPSDETRPVGMFDILAFTERGEYYRVFPEEGGRLALTPIDEDSAGSKLGKVVDKRHVEGGRIQLTLHDGRTLVTDETDVGGGDSVVVSNDDGEIVAHFPYEEGALVTAVDGRHAGEIGRIEEIRVTPGSGSNDVVVDGDDGGFETVSEYVVIIDENFVDGSGDGSEDADEEEASADDEAEAETETPDDDDDEEVTEE